MCAASWNCWRSVRESVVWEHLLHLNPDIALLQEVGNPSAATEDRYQIIRRKAITKTGNPQRFDTAVLTSGQIIEEVQPRAGQEQGPKCPAGPPRNLARVLDTPFIRPIRRLKHTVYFVLYAYLRVIVNADFETIVDQAIAKCKTLSESDARHFVEHGWVVVKGAVPKQIAKDIVACAWRELEDRGIKKDDPETWKKELYIRTGCPPNVHIMASRGDKEAAKQKLEIRTRYGLPPESPLLQEVAPRALGAQVDCTGGRERVDAPARIILPDSLAVNLCSDDSNLGEGGWCSTRAPGWHKDGWHYRHFLDSPQQGLLLGYIYSDLLPDSGGTQMCVDSIGVVARLLARHPEGIHPDTVYSYIKPYMVKECSQFRELTGEAGDLAIMHPYMVHRVAGNASGRPRFGQFPSIKLSRPTQFSREDLGHYSLAELVVLKELGQLTHLDFAKEADYTKYPREDITPPPSRTEEEKRAIEIELYDEQRRMALTEPQWAQDMWPKRERP